MALHTGGTGVALRMEIRDNADLQLNVAQADKSAEKGL
jgi:hypothetical protein